MNNRKSFIFFVITLGLLTSFSQVSWAMAKKPAAPLLTEPDKPAAAELEKVSLYECYRKAQRLSEMLKIRQEEIRKTNADFLTAAGESIGDVNFVATDFFQDARSGSGSEGSSVGGTLTSAERRERKFVIDQPLFQGFKSLGALAGAGSLKKQRIFEAAEAEENLFLLVSETFYSVMREQRDISTMQEIRSILMDRIKDLKGREKIGRSRASEVASARSKLKLLEAALAQSRGDLALAQQNLYYFTGREFEADELLEPVIPYTRQTPLEEFLKDINQRPDVRAAKEAEKTARRAIIVKQSVLWPTISLVSNHYNQREGFQAGIDWDALFKVDVPLFTGGTSLGEVKKSISEWRQAKLNFSLKKREGDLNIRRAYEKWKSSLSQYEALQEAVKASKENFDYQKEEYQRSLVNNLDVLEALQTLLETRREANKAYYSMKLDFWNLEVSAGHCCEDIEMLERTMTKAGVNNEPV